MKESLVNEKSCAFAKLKGVLQNTIYTEIQTYGCAKLEEPGEYRDKCPFKAGKALPS